MTRPGAFVAENEAYALLAEAGLTPPRHGFVDAGPPFHPGESVVLKGLGADLWHKSELGAVLFAGFDAAALSLEATRMRHCVEWSGHAWLGGLVCERIDFLRQNGLPSEAVVSLSRSEAGWVIMLGLGGMQADALAGLAPPCRWPVDAVGPDAALADLDAHLLGRIWLGRERGTRPLTSLETLHAFLRKLWRLAALADARGLDLLEINPFALDAHGEPRPLDAAGRRAEFEPPPHHPPKGWLAALRGPRRIALAGVSSEEGGVGRTILENLRRCPACSGHLTLIKPGHTKLLGLPCLPDVSGLRGKPADLLILAVPAPAATDMLLALVQQGGGARCVALVPGGIGDGADAAGLAARIAAALEDARGEGKWTPAVLGPNFLGHWVPESGLDTSFIPPDKVAAPAAEPGPLTLLSQSGAFLLSRRSRQPGLRFRLAVSLGNQFDVSLADCAEALAAEAHPGPLACYIEGFGPGQLRRFAAAARRLISHGATVLVHRAGRTETGRAAALTHTGALAGDWDLEQQLLRRSGVKLAPSIADFDAALAWLDAHPRLTVDSVAVVTNAGFESVNAGDLFDALLPSALLPDDARLALIGSLEAHGLAGLVSPRLPLDLTPMADESAFLAAADIVLRHTAALVIGLVPFTRRLATTREAAAGFAGKLAELAAARAKPVGIAVDAGSGYEDYRAAFAAARLPVFGRVESALRGLRVLA